MKKNETKFFSPSAGLAALFELGWGGAILFWLMVCAPEPVRAQSNDGCFEYFVTVQKVQPTLNGNGTPNATDPGPIFGYFKFYLNTTDPNGFPGNMLPSYIGIQGDISGNSPSVRLIAPSSFPSPLFPPTVISQALAIHEDDGNFSWEMGNVQQFPCASIENLFPTHGISIELFTIVVSGATGVAAFLQNCKMTIANCHTGCAREVAVADETINFPTLNNCSPQITANFVYDTYYSAPNPIPTFTNAIGVFLNFAQATNVAEMAITLRFEPNMTGSVPLSFLFFQTGGQSPEPPSWMIKSIVYNENDRTTDVSLIFSGAWSANAGANLIGVFYFSRPFNNSAGGRVSCKLLNSSIVRMNANFQLTACRIPNKTQSITIPGLPVSNRLSMSVQPTDGPDCQRSLEFLFQTNNNSNAIVRVTRLKLEFLFRVPPDNSLSQQPIFVNLPNCNSSNCSFTQDSQNQQFWRFSYEYIAPAGNFLEIKGIANGIQTKMVFPMVLNSGCIDFYLIAGEITTYTTNPPGIEQAIDYILPTPVNQICATKITGYVTDVAGNLSNAKQNTTIINASSNVNSLYNKHGVWKDCGFFSFCVNPIGFPYTVEIPNNRTDVPLCGVTTYDLLLIRRHILGVEPLPTAAQFIAADANGDEDMSDNLIVNGLDVEVFRTMILGGGNTPKNWTYLNFLFNAHASSNNYSINTNTVFNSNREQVIGQSDVAEFTAVKHGDVNLSCGCDFEQKPAPTAAIEIQPKITSAQHLAIPIRLTHANEPFAALQFAFTIDTLAYEIASIIPNELIGIKSADFSMHAKQKGEVRFAWFQTDFESFLRNGDLLFTVYLQPIGNRKLIDEDNSMIQLSPIIESVGYSSEGVEFFLEVRTTKPKERTESLILSDWNVYLSPNPVGSNDHLRVSIETTEASFVLCNIVDISGKITHSFSKKMQSGENQFYIDTTNVLSGVYFLTLTDTNGRHFASRIVKL